MPGLSTTILALCCFGLLSRGVRGITVFQERNETFAVPSNALVSSNGTSPVIFSTASKSDALASLVRALGSDSNTTIAYPGDTSYGATIARVWTRNRQLWPDAVVYPATAQDVSLLMNFYAQAGQKLWGTDGFAVMCGGHADMGGAQSPSVVLDMQKMGTTAETVFATDRNVRHDAPSTSWPILKIGGGSESAEVFDALAGTGWAFLGPRAGSIGVGGFLLGGGIAYQTGRYGMAADNLVGLEVVLLDGRIVYANPHNEHADLFWACTGAGWLGFGVVTHFYIQAYPDPGPVITGTIAWNESMAPHVFEKTTEFFETNRDPDAFPALLYYFKDPTNVLRLLPLRDRQFTFQLNAVYFGGDMAKFNETYGQFYPGAASITFQTWTLQTLDTYLLTNYPYGYNRIFYGKSHTNSTVEFYQKTFDIYKGSINGLIARGEDPGHTLWVDEYIFPAWNGRNPATDADAAWPHATSSHVTLSSVEWSNNSNTAFVYDREENHFASYLRDFQNQDTYKNAGIAYDYPNYIAPFSRAAEVWGSENFERLLDIKQKYDPDCMFNRGRVLGTPGCVAKRLANTWL